MKNCIAALAAGIASLALCAGHVSAQAFPNKPVRLVVPYGAGGAPDVSSRMIGQKMSETLGQQVVIDNKPGAGGIIAAELVAKSPADGYALFVADTGHFAINPALYPKLPYDPLRDFTPVATAVSTPLILVANPTTLPVNNVAEMIAAARAKPGIPFGSSGNGSPHQLFMEMLKQAAGVQLTHVPYKGVAQSVPGILSGDVAMLFVGITSVKAHVTSGKLRVLAVSTGKRSALMPEAPTVAEAGGPALDLAVSITWLAPTGTPRDAIARLHQELARTLQNQDIAQKLNAAGIEVVAAGPEQTTELIRTDMAKYGKLVREANVKVD